MWAGDGRSLFFVSDRSGSKISGGSRPRPVDVEVKRPIGESYGNRMRSSTKR